MPASSRALSLLPDWGTAAPAFPGGGSCLMRSCAAYTRSSPAFVPRLGRKMCFSRGPHVTPAGPGTKEFDFLPVPGASDRWLAVARPGLEPAARPGRSCSPRACPQEAWERGRSVHRGESPECVSVPACPRCRCCQLWRPEVPGASGVGSFGAAGRWRSSPRALTWASSVHVCVPVWTHGTSPP